MRIITSAIVASALFAGGAAFAQGGGAGNPALPRDGQPAISAQSQARNAVERGVTIQRAAPSPQASTSQGFFPIDTTNLNRGPSR